MTDTTNILNLPDEVLVYLLQQKTSCVTRFMFLRTCQQALGLKPYFKPTKTVALFKESLKISALRSGNVDLIDEIIEMGIEISYKDYSLDVSVCDLDFMLYVRERIEIPQGNYSLYGVLCNRIMQYSTSEECIRYGLFLDLDRKVTTETYGDADEKIPKKLRFSEGVYIRLYCHEDENMFEKMNIGSRRHALKQIIQRNPVVLGTYGNMRLFNDIEQFCNMKNFWLRPRWKDIIQTVFYRYCGYYTALSTLEELFKKDYAPKEQFHNFYGQAIRTANYKALQWCISHTISIPIGRDDIHLEKILRQKSIPFIRLNNKTYLYRYYTSVETNRMNTTKFTDITRLLIELGMPINHNIFRSNFSEMVNIETIEVLIQAGAKPHYNLLVSAIIKRPDIVPRLLELGFSFPQETEVHI